ncbi:unnamed protein product [Orchesella dallaii]|uniref:Uncharacterized protein n=1 Tax=Orchesella dallaii TaxID=48710 RepID=A0ABP1R001_9HEXA
MISYQMVQAEGENEGRTAARRNLNEVKEVNLPTSMQIQTGRNFEGTIDDSTTSSVIAMLQKHNKFKRSGATFQFRIGVLSKITPMIPPRSAPRRVSIFGSIT